MLELFDNINPLLFLVVFCLGFYLCNYFSPKPKIIVMRPTPANSDTLFFKEQNNMSCYRYKTISTNCSSKEEDYISLEDLLS